MGRIHVQVVRYGDCRNLVLRWKDPTTGKWQRTTKYCDPRTGEEIETGTDRRHAKKLAALLERDLMAGLAAGPGATSWGQFRLRYEAEVVPSLADRTADKIGTTFNAVERILPKVAVGRLVDLNAEAISRFQAELRDGKRSENTIAGYLAHLRAALAWAHDQGLIPVLPKIRRPQRAKKGGRGRKAKGRPVTGEEFDRMLAAVGPALAESRTRKREEARQAARKKGVPERKLCRTEPIPMEVSPAVVESWRQYLRGLWLSGLRLTESLKLYWDRQDRLCVDLSGRHPRLSIPDEHEKGHRDRLLPMTPDFAAFLLAAPEADRHGPVFSPLTLAGNRASGGEVGRVVSLIGELARVVVHTDPKTGRIKFASCHSLRASFGTRWARKVMPAVLQKLMRHESIETSMGYYVDLDTDELAEDLYRASAKEPQERIGTIRST
jgi:integrase